MENIKHLVIGIGEIGQALYDVLSEHYDVEKYDQNGEYYATGRFEVIHICFGHKENETEDFIKWVQSYQRRFLATGGLTIIHSTVAVGISRQLKAVHSPIRGQHSNLARSIKKFTKLFGGERAGAAADYFRKIGIKVMIFDTPEATEVAKLFSTEYYKVCIDFATRVKKYCDKYNLNYSEVYRIPNQTYNEGYQQLGYNHYTRPVLEPLNIEKGKEKETGGHCVMPNSKLLEISENGDNKRDK